MKSASPGKSGSLELTGVRKKIGLFELVADFRVAHGERAALIGQSGSGKTSLLRMIAGLISPDAGRVFMSSRDLTSLPVHKRRMGLVFQDQALFPSMNVLENAAFGLKMEGMPKRLREYAAMELLGRVKLSHRAHAPVSELSGGERQRLAFVRAMAWKPDVLLLDEPFSALDPGLRAELRAQLLMLHALWPVPLVLVSHDSEDVSAIANVRLEIQMSQDGTRREVIRA